MTSYIIAGSSDCKETTECERIARAIKKVYTSLDFKIILKHPSEWMECIRKLCRHYGFKEQHNPIVFTSDGKLIGGIKEFYELASQKFAFAGDMLTEKLDHSVNVKLANDDYHERHRQKSLIEKIINKYAHCLNHQLTTKVSGFYQEKEESGLIFYVKFTEDISPKIIVDPINKPIMIQEEVFENVDIDFRENPIMENEPKEDFIKAFEKNKAMKLAEDRSDSVPELYPNDSKKDLTIGSNGPYQDPILEEAKDNLDYIAEGIEPDKRALKLQNFEELGLSNTINDQSPHQQQQQMQSAIASFRGKMPDNAEFIDLEKYIIQDLEDNYYLAIHPYPVHEGQCVLFYRYKIKSESSGTNNSISTEIGLLDYSLNIRERIETKSSKFDNGYSANSSAFQKTLEPIAPASLLNKEKLDLYDPLAGADWLKAYYVVVETDSYAMIQYLPANKSSHMKMSNGIINIFPRKFLLREYKNFGVLNIQNQSSIEQLPIEVVITKSIEKQHKFIKEHQQQHQMHHQIEEMEKVYHIDELPFIHGICILEEKSNTDLNLGKIYEGMIKYLDHKYYNQSIKDYGLNIILGKKWIMLIPLTNPVYTQQNTPFYMLPSAFIGYIISPIFQNIWPQSGGLEKNVFNKSIIDMLTLSTRKLE